MKLTTIQAKARKITELTAGELADATIASAALESAALGAIPDEYGNTILSVIRRTDTPECRHYTAMFALAHIFRDEQERRLTYHGTLRAIKGRNA